MSSHHTNIFTKQVLNPLLPLLASLALPSTLLVLSCPSQASTFPYPRWLSCSPNLFSSSDILSFSDLSLLESSSGPVLLLTSSLLFPIKWLKWGQKIPNYLKNLTLWDPPTPFKEKSPTSLYLYWCKCAGHPNLVLYFSFPILQMGRK